MILSVAEAIHQRLLLPAINLDHCTIDEMRQIGGEVSDETGNLLALLARAQPGIVRTQNAVIRNTSGVAK